MSRGTRVSIILLGVALLQGCGTKEEKALNGSILCAFPTQEAWAAQYVGSSQFKLIRLTNLDPVCKNQYPAERTDAKQPIP